MDNRLENLLLVPQLTKVPEPDDPSEKASKEQCLYWVAIQQLPADPLQEVRPISKDVYINIHIHINVNIYKHVSISVSRDICHLEETVL